MISLKNIYIYPLKSAAGIELSRAKLDERGIENDRRWMLVDADGSFISQRQKAAMAKISTEMVGKALGLTFPNGLRVEVPPQPRQGKMIPVTIWQDNCRVLQYDSDVNRIFSDYLGEKCSLVVMPVDEPRPVDPNYSSQTVHVNFPDGFPLLLITTASLRDLNEKAPEEIPASRFRANIIIENRTPFAEDSWAKIRIGNISFRVVKPCARCIITTIDQHSAVRGKEPLKTLSKFRKIDNKIYFGQNLIHEQRGEIFAGERLEVLAQKPGLFR